MFTYSTARVLGSSAKPYFYSNYTHKTTLKLDNGHSISVSLIDGELYPTIKCPKNVSIKVNSEDKIDSLCKCKIKLRNYEYNKKTEFKFKDEIVEENYDFNSSRELFYDFLIDIIKLSDKDRSKHNNKIKNTSKILLKLVSDKSKSHLLSNKNTYQDCKRQITLIINNPKSHSREDIKESFNEYEKIFEKYILEFENPYNEECSNAIDEYQENLKAINQILLCKE